MTAFIVLVLIYLFPLLGVLVFYLYYHNQRDKKVLDSRNKQDNAPPRIPVSLRPVIDTSKCIGCGACATACPEHNVIGIINREAVLVAPSKCIGHGACKTACPFDAISLVFGTEKRGIDIPYVRPNFETNIPGLFIAGELGGMGLIANAIEQGRQSMEAISAAVKRKKKADDVFDVVIVGAGPAGFSASLSAMEKGMDYLTLEQEALGGTVAHYPRGKIIMTRPVVLPVIGKVNFKETTKEQLLEFWQKAEIKSGVKINYCECVEKVVCGQSYFSVSTQRNTYKARAVLLAIGRRGVPKKLGVQGEEKNKVVYRVTDPNQYEAQHVLVVGHSDSALEAALSLEEIPVASITLVYLKEILNGVKQDNLERTRAAQEKGKLNLLLNSNIKEIGDSEVILHQAGDKIVIKNDTVIVCVGGVFPVTFLKEIGVQMETKYGAP